MTIHPDGFAGVLLGMAVGDALGLPREGMSRSRAQRRWGDRPVEHALLFGRGMISDDTEHACMTAQALLASGSTVSTFQRSLSWRLRGWLLAMPAGIGLATLKAIIRLWCGFGVQRAGVRSAGNGPAMRAPILGIWMEAAEISHEARRQWVDASTCLTHTDERAGEGALAIALVTGWAARGDVRAGEAIEQLTQYIHGEQLRHALNLLPVYLAKQASTESYADALGLARGVSGYINHTVPVALYCHFRWPGDFRRAVEDAVRIGGDTDTLAAIVGGMSGAALGAGAIPSEWLDGLLEWPRSVRWMQRLAQRLSQHAETPNDHASPLPLFWPGLIPRNVIFAVIVLAHGFRRLFPPY